MLEGAAGEEVSDGGWGTKRFLLASLPVLSMASASGRVSMSGWVPLVIACAVSSVTSLLQGERPVEQGTFHLFLFF